MVRIRHRPLFFVLVFILYSHLLASPVGLLQRTKPQKDKLLKAGAFLGSISARENWTKKHVSMIEWEK